MSEIDDFTKRTLKDFTNPALGKSWTKEDTAAAEAFYAAGGKYPPLHPRRAVPDVTIAVRLRSGEYYGIAGFDEFHRYMMRNHPLYCAEFKRAESIGMSEADRLRITLVAMARESLHFRDAFAEQVERAGFPSFSFTVEPKKP